MKDTVKIPPEILSRIYQVKEELVDSHKKCHGSGYKRDGSGNRCGCMIIFRYLKELIKSNIPQDYWTMTLSKIKLDELLNEIVKTYITHLKRAKQKGLGLVLFGLNGTGKTSVMAEIAKHAILSKYKVRYFTLSSYVDAVFSKNTERIAYYEDGDFLLIDELDKKAGTSNIYKLVDEFLRRMFNQNKSMIFGTNWDADEFKEHLGESTFSLLMRRSEFLEFHGSDYSVILQESYLDRLEQDYDYYNPVILDRATKYELLNISEEA